MPDEAREVRPFSLDFDPTHDADFTPKIVEAEADEGDPKALSAPERVDFSDTVPSMDQGDGDLSGAAATQDAVRVITPPKVPSPGKQVS